MHEAFMYFYKRSILNLEDLLNLSATVDIIPYGLVDMFSKAFNTANLKKLNFQFIDSSVVKINKAIEARLKAIEYAFEDDPNEKTQQNDNVTVVSPVPSEISSEWTSTSNRPIFEENMASSRQLVNDYQQKERVSLNLSDPAEKDAVPEAEFALPVDQRINDLRTKLRMAVERTRKTMEEQA